MAAKRPLDGGGRSSMMKLPKRPRVEVTFEDEWKTLEAGFQQIISGFQEGLSLDRYTELYRLVYEICTSKHGKAPALYTAIATFFHDHVSQIAHELLNTPDGMLLNKFSEAWRQFRQAATFICTRLCDYMVSRQRTEQRYWIPKQGCDNLFHLSLSIWKEVLLHQIAPRVVDMVCDLIRDCREGVVLEKNVIKTVINTWVEFGVDEGRPLTLYRRDIEEEILSRSSEYYRAKSDLFLASNSGRQFFNKTIQVLNEESDFCKKYIHPSSEPELRRVVEQIWVRNRISLLSKEFENMLAESRIDDLKRLLHLLKSFREGVGEVALRFKGYVRRKFDDLLSTCSTQSLTGVKLNTAMMTVEKLLETEREYRMLCKECFTTNLIFHEKLDECLRVLGDCDIGPFKLAELLSLQADKLLRGKHKIADSALEERIEGIVKLLTYLKDKDLFHESYRRALCERLLTRKFNEDLERYTISLIKGECGTHFAKKLECMFQDIMISSEANEHFEEYLQSSAACIPFALTVNVRRVLNSMHWPIKMRKAVPIKPVDLFVRAQETYEQFYRTRAANKKLQWDYFHGTVSIIALLPTKVEVVCSTLQAFVLLLCEEKEFTLDEIVHRIGSTVEELTSSIRPIIREPWNVLIEAHKDGQVKYGINPNFSKKCKARRAIVPKEPVASLMSRRSVAANAQLKEDRRMQVDAAMVRIMKARRRMPIDALLLQVVKQVASFFTPETPYLQERMEVLIDQEFFERDSRTPTFVRYLA